MSESASRRPFFESLKTGLEEGIQYYQGKIQLRTTELPDRRAEFTDIDVLQLRERLGLTQKAFAQILNVSLKTVQNWEEGKRKPTRVALRLLQVLQTNPKIVGLVAGVAIADNQIINGP